MEFVFSERKAAEAAAHLLQMAGGSMSYMVLIKLLYMADRQTLIDRGLSITGDQMFSMEDGPVLSRVLDRIKSDARQTMKTWQRFVSPPKNYEVHLLEPPPAEGGLSNYEIDVLRDVYRKYGRLDKWDFVKMLHKLPEYHDPAGSSVRIKHEEILMAAGKTTEEIAWRVELAQTTYAANRSPRS